MYFMDYWSCTHAIYLLAIHPVYLFLVPGLSLDLSSLSQGFLVLGYLS